MPGTVVTMGMTVDEALAELREIRRLLEATPGDDPARVTLEQRRDRLHAAAQHAADAARDPEVLRLELDHLERRLARFDGDKINVRAWQIADGGGAKLSLNDPAAFATRLNELLDEANAPGREEIEARIAQLRAVLDTAAT